MMKLFLGIVLYALSCCAEPLPKICACEEENTVFWAKVCQSILSSNPQIDSFRETLAATDFTPAVLVQGYLHRDLRKSFYYGYLLSAANHQFELSNIPLSTETLIEALKRGVLEVLEIKKEGTTQRHYNLIYSWRFEGIMLTLDILDPVSFPLECGSGKYVSKSSVTLLGPHPFLKIQQPPFACLRALYHQNLLLTENSNYKIGSSLPSFTFFNLPYSEDEIAAAPAPQKNLYVSFNKEYAFGDYVLNTEGTSLSAVRTKAQLLYDQHKDDEQTDMLHIPLIHHKVWVTNPQNPRELPDEYFGWWEKSIHHMHPSDGWQHWLWIEDATLLPQTVKRAKALGITIKQIWRDCPNLDPYKPLINMALQNKWYSIPSNVLRFVLLKEFGGVWMDTDYEVYKDLAPLCHTYDLCVGHEPGTAKIGNSIILARQNHPLLNRALELILRTINDATKPAYLTDPNPAYNPHQTFAHFGSGTMLFTLAFALEPCDQDRKDIVFPPYVFYPTHSRSYPVGCHDVITPFESHPADSYGVHYWELSWSEEKSQLKPKAH